MKITAIWDRHIPAPKSSAIFCLLDNGEFLELRLAIEYQGTNAEGKSLYKETGEPRYGAVFNEKDRFTIGRADFMIKHFGGTLLVDFERRNDEKRTRSNRQGERIRTNEGAGSTRQLHWLF